MPPRITVLMLSTDYHTTFKGPGQSITDLNSGSFLICDRVSSALGAEDIECIASLMGSN